MAQVITGDPNLQGLLSLYLVGAACAQWETAGGVLLRV